MTRTTSAIPPGFVAEPPARLHHFSEADYLLMDIENQTAETEQPEPPQVPTYEQIDEWAEALRVSPSRNELHNFASVILAAAIPPGHVVVPVEPTEAMLDAGWNYYITPLSRGDLPSTYAAMIAARPGATP